MVVWHRSFHEIFVNTAALEALGIEPPTAIRGVQQSPIEGTSMLYSFNDGDAPEQHDLQYFEMFGNRGIYHEGWTAVTKHVTPWDPADKPSLNADVWELYNIEKDFSLTRNLAKTYPEKLKELQAIFKKEAIANSVFPLDDRLYEQLARATDKLSQGLAERASAAGVPVTLNQVCGMFGLFFTAGAVSEFDHAATSILLHPPKELAAGAVAWVARDRGVDGVEHRVDECDLALEQLPRGAPVNVILFPMEGDPDAPSAYWKLAVATSGSFLSPSKDWP